MVLRILDANFDRAREGLRVLEDIARFGLDDQQLAAALRGLRHQVGNLGRPLTLDLVSARRASDDVGGPSEAKPELGRTSLADVVAANARRVQESLRVLEELAKLPDAHLDPGAAAALEQARFRSYDLERTLLGRVSRQHLAELVRGLYFILDPDMTAGRDPVTVVTEALAGGVRVVQLRDKHREKGYQLALAQRVRDACHASGAVFLVNDHPDVALAVGADGVHVGQKDLPLEAARRMLPLRQIVGVSTATVPEALAAAAGGADYVAVGAMFSTQSKSDTRPAGLETLRRVREQVRRQPLVAIGGINGQNLGEVVRAGADAIAVISAIGLAPDVRAAAAALVEAFAHAHDAER